MTLAREGMQLSYKDDDEEISITSISPERVCEYVFKRGVKGSLKCGKRGKG